LPKQKKTKKISHQEEQLLLLRSILAELQKLNATLAEGRVVASTEIVEFKGNNRRLEEGEDEEEELEYYE
jgi:hypothetical protein